MVILVDMDDTIELFLKAWINGVNKQYGRNVAYEDIKTWDVAVAFPGLTREQVYSIPMQHGFWSNVEPIENAAEVLSRLMAKGHEVYIVTAASYDSVFEKMSEVLFRYFPFIKWDQVIISSHKQLIRGDILIDDGVHNLEGGHYKKILMTAPHNITYNAEAHGMIRVHNWQEIEHVISQIQHREYCND